MKIPFQPILVLLALVAGLISAAQAGAPAYHEALLVDAALDRPVVPANQSENVVVQIKVLPAIIDCMPDRPPVNLSLVLDRSGSMSGEKIEQAIQAAETAVGHLGPQDMLSIIIYDDQVDTLVPATEVTPSNLRSIKQALRTVTSRGNTAIYAGLNQAAAELRRASDRGYINRMILLSDGLANSGPSRVEDFRALGRAFAREDIVISTVGLGLGYNEDIMTTLAQAGQGNTYFVENADDLPRIFAGELGDALNVAVTDIEIIVRPRGDTQIIRSVGREAELEGDTARFHMSQAYSGLEKLALLEVRAPEGSAGQVEDLVEIEVNYLPVGMDTTQTQQVAVPITYTDEAEEVLAAARTDVALNVVENRVAEAKEEAIAYADAGDRHQAAERLRNEVGSITSSYGFLGGSVIAEPSAALESEADEVEAEGISGARRKEYRADSFQSVNQQSVQ